MNKTVHAIAVSASRVENGIKQRYAAVKKDDEGFFGNKIEWDWYPESSISNINNLSQKMNEYLANSSNSISLPPSNSVSIGRRPKNSRKKSKASSAPQKNDENPNLKNIQMMEGDLLYSFSTDNLKLDPCSKALNSKLFTNDSNVNKKIIKILSCAINRTTGQITWKVKIEDNNRTIEISHAELIMSNRELFIEYCKHRFVDDDDDNL